MTALRVVVVGATGLVGGTIIRVLEERAIPLSELKLLASARSTVTRLRFGSQDIEVQALCEQCLSGSDIVFFAAGADVSRNYAPIARSMGALVVDNSSAFRRDPGIPLIVPEVNGKVLEDGREHRLIANPNCSTIQLVVALSPLHEAFGLESVVVSTYQSVSGTGAKGLLALERELQSGERSVSSPYPHPISGNILPQVDVLDDEGWSGEERKMVHETQKILNLPSLHVVPTAVRVPVRVCHSESVLARFARRTDASEGRRLLAAAAGVTVIDEPAESRYPLALNAEGYDDVFVGRIRQDPFDDRALAFWVVADNLRKGAATNAVQIAESALRCAGRNTTDG